MSLYIVQSCISEYIIQAYIHAAHASFGTVTLKIYCSKIIKTVFLSHPLETKTYPGGMEHETVFLCGPIELCSDSLFMQAWGCL